MFGQQASVTKTLDTIHSVALVRQVHTLLPWLVDSTGFRAGHVFFRILFGAYKDDLLKAERAGMFVRLDTPDDLDEAEAYLRRLRPMLAGMTHDLGRRYDAVIKTIASMPLREEIRNRHIRCFITHACALAQGIRNARARLN